MARRRVVITGIGVVSALGRDAREFWQALVEGRPGIGPITLIDMSPMRFQNGAQARSFNPAEHFQQKEMDFLDRFAQFAVVAAREAVRDSGIEWTSELRERSAIVTGSKIDVPQSTAPRRADSSSSSGMFSATHSPGFTSKLTPLTACTPPKCLTSWRTCNVTG